MTFWNWLFPKQSKRAEVSSITVVSLPKGASDKYAAMIEWSDGRKWEARGYVTCWHKYPTGEAIGSSLTLKILDAVKVYEWSKERSVV